MSLDAPVTVDERAGRREWIGLAVLALPTLLLALDLSVTYLAIPLLSADLGAGPAQLLWIADIYPFMLSGFLITMGNLGDRIGRRKLLLIGAAMFGIASLLAAFSQTSEMLIIARALLGIAGASLMPSTLALITNMFRDPKQRAFSFAIWVSCFMGGTALGPVIGGVVMHAYWWGAAFLLGVPVMVVLLITGPIFLPEYRNPGAGRIDLLSVGMSLAAILPIVYGIKDLAANGAGVLPLVTIAVGLLFGVAFVKRQYGLADPLLDLRLFTLSSFRVATLSLMSNSIAMSGVALLVNQYLESVQGLSPLTAGLWLAPASMAVIVSSLLAPKLVQRVRPAFVIAGGTAITATGCVILTQVDPSSPTMVVEIGYLLGMFGVGPIVALATELIVGQAQPEKAGAAGALKETADHLGFAFGAALLGSIATAFYRNTLEVPAGAAAVAGDASKTLAEAVAAARDLPAQDAEFLLSAARSAFTDGFNIAAAVAAGIAVLIIVFVLGTLRHIPPTGTGTQANNHDDESHRGDAESGADDSVPSQQQESRS